MVHLAAVHDSITAEQTAHLFMDLVFRMHGMPIDIVSDRDPRFTAMFWQELFRLLGTSLSMSTADHPETDGQTERANRVIVSMLRSFSLAHPRDWSTQLPMVEFAMNNAVHSSTTYSPFYMNYFRHPRIPALLSPREGTSSLGGGGTHHSDVVDMDESIDNSMHPLEDAIDTHHADTADMDASIVQVPTDDDVPTATQPLEVAQAVSDPSVSTSHIDECTTPVSMPITSQGSDNSISIDVDHYASEGRPTRRSPSISATQQFLDTRKAILTEVRDMIAEAVDKQKMFADRNGRKNLLEFKVGDKVLLSTSTLPLHAVNNVGSNKLLPKYIGPFNVLKVKGTAYTIDLPKSMRTHPTFYVGRLKPYHSHDQLLSCPQRELPPRRKASTRQAGAPASTSNARARLSEKQVSSQTGVMGIYRYG
jgi:hypothetical protein